MRSLNIKHVSIMSQSGGAVYAFDLLLHYPELLYPEHPYLAIGAPWTHPVHSHVMAMRITHMLPRSAIGSLDKLLSTFNSVQGVIGPALQFISGARPYSSSTELASTADGEAIKFETNVQGKLLAHFNDHGFAGIADEAIMLLRRADDTGNGWGSWGDYDKLLPQLSTALRSAGGKLTVRSFWAEKDAITGDAGTAGPSWLIQCLQMEAEDSDAAITHSSFVVLGADHDTVWDLRFGMSQHVFKEISGKDPVASNEGS